MTLEQEKHDFQIIEPYINCFQEQKKKVVYIKTGYWNDIYNPTYLHYNKSPWIYLRSAMGAAGYDLRQIDSFEGLQDFVHLIVLEIFNDQISQFSQYPKEKLISILWEPPSVMPQNYLPENHVYFSRVYTWNDELVDNYKYFKIAYPDLLPMTDNLVDFSAKKLAVLVASNKGSGHPKELYSARMQVIDFYENKHREDFDLYGSGWPSFDVYKGIILGTLSDRVEKLKSYKFCYAYENILDEPGYITEKIFNCFQAGSVPIYWGASNITQYVPEKCFIDRAKFSNDEDLYLFLKNMREDEHLEYLENIREYLISDQAKVFTMDHFIKTFMGMFEQ